MKISEIQDLSMEELAQQQEEVQREIFNMKVQQSIGQLENPSRLRHLRRDVARIKTVMHQKRNQG